MKSVVNFDVGKEYVAHWVARLPSVMDGYKPKDIANGDETGLSVHSKQSCSKGEKCYGGKLHTERLTVLLCHFMTGR
jgi:hypothetical protein